MSLADEIVIALPRLMEAHPNGPRAAHIAAFIAAPEASVRRAMGEIKEREIGIVVRYPGSKARHVVPMGHNFGSVRLRTCAHCDALFKRPNKDTRFCCISCFAQDMWSNPERREKASVSSKRAAQLPSRKAVTERLVARQRSEEGRKETSERNRQLWADPAHKAKRSAAIQAVNGSPEGRKKFSKHFKENWQDPETRARAVERMRETHADPAVKAKYRAAARKKWDTPEYREKMMARAEDFGKKMSRLNKGRKRTPESIAKGKETRRRNADARGYWRRPTDKKFEPST